VIYESNEYILHNVSIPISCWESGGRDEKRLARGTRPSDTPVCVDHLATVDIEVCSGCIVGIYGTGPHLKSYVERMPESVRRGKDIVDLRGKLVLPTFTDLHTHIGT